jgi:hypothetical protein
VLLLDVLFQIGVPGRRGLQQTSSATPAPKAAAELTCD